MGVLFVTGAGISASAGIPTYRDTGSNWRNKELQQMTYANRYGNHLDELWDVFWGPMSEVMRKAEPTRAHLAIAEFQQRHPETIIATQNIDDLHERAGSDNVAHVHGTMDIRCLRCKHLKALDTKWKKRGAPICPNCGGKKTRPDVVLFGEALNKKQYRGLEHFANTASHVIVVGSSLNVHPIAGLVMDQLSGMAETILINEGDAQFQNWFKQTHHFKADDVIDDVLAEVDKSFSTV